jgi:hypothetical protein
MTMATDDRIKAKSNKLLALSASDNENESRTALRQAMALMKKHSLKDSDLITSEVETIKHITTYRKFPRWCTLLSGHIARALGVYLVERSGSNSPSGFVELFFTGADGAAERAEYIYITANRVIESMAVAWRRAHHPSPPRWACNDYRQGLAIAYGKRIKEVYGDMEKEMASETGMALIPIDTRLDTARDFYINNLPDHIRIRLVSGSSRNSSALHQGIKDGKQVSVTEGVRGNTHKTPLLS